LKIGQSIAVATFASRMI